MKLIKSGFLTLIGLPNAGKSSLFNALVGSPLSIVTPKAQTTRKNLRGFLASENLELVVVDTPGLQDGTKALNVMISKNAAQAVQSAKQGREVIALVLDAIDLGARLRDGRHLGLERIHAALLKEKIKLPMDVCLLPVFNKADLIRKQEYKTQLEIAVTPFLNSICKSPQPFVWLSTKTKEGKESPQALLEKVSELLPSGNSGELFDTEELSDQNMREFASEFIREQCFLQLGEELPYSVAIRIDQFKEETNLTRIEATVFVERDSQKPMLIGRGGEKIKAIGTKARAKIEEMLGTKAFLGLKVKVSPHWSQNQGVVERFLNG